MALGSGRLTARLARPAPTSHRRDRSMIFGPPQRALPALVRRDLAAETVVAARSGVGAMNDDGRGDGPSDWL